MVQTKKNKFQKVSSSILAIFCGIQVLDIPFLTVVDFMEAFYGPYFRLCTTAKFLF